MFKKYLSKLSLLLLMSICVNLCSSVVALSEEEIKFVDETAFITFTRRQEQRKELPTNVSVITSKEIEQLGARNVGEAIAHLTSIDIGRYGTLGSLSSARIRNSTSEQVQILINGTPLTGVSFGSANLSQIPLDNIERIEIVRGPSSVLYGANAVSGVINIITRKPRTPVPMIQFDAGYGSFDTQIYKISAELQREKLGVFASGSRQSSAGFRENSKYDNDNFALSLGYDFPKFGKLSFEHQYFRGDLGVPGSNSTPINMYNGEKELKATTPNAKQSNTIHNLQLSYENKFSSDFGINTKLYSRTNNHSYADPPAESTKMDNYIIGADIQLNLPNNLILGYVHNRDSYDTKQLVTGAYVNTKKQLDNRAIYVQQSISLIPKLRIIPAARFDLHQLFGNYLSPGLSAVFLPTKNLKFSGSIGKAFRAPTFSDLYWPRTDWAGGNPELKPEESVGYELGTELSDGVNAARISYFNREVNEQIRWCPSDPANPFSPWTPSNVDNALASGVETEFEFTLTENLTNKLNWSFVNNTIKKKGEEQKGFQKPAYSPEHTVSYMLRYIFPMNIFITATIEYVAQQYSQDDKKGVELPSYTLANLRLSQKIGLLEYFVAVENISNKRYITRDGYPLPGITYSLGVNLRFLI